MDKIVIDGVIGGWEVDSKNIINQLNTKTGDVLVLLNSVGGSVLHGISIFNAFKAYKKGTIAVRITGIAASIASYIALAGDKIEAFDNTTFMIHNASLPAFSDYRGLRKAADISEGLTSIISKAYISKTGMSEKNVRKLMDDETFYYGAEMLDAGFVDEIISTESATNKAEALSVAIESLKACNNAIQKKENGLSLEAVAKLLPQKEEVVETKIKVVDLSAQQQRARKLSILNKEIQC
ncbi:MAG: Clp protease ClpP [Sulfurimonas sp.]